MFCTPPDLPAATAAERTAKALAADTERIVAQSYRLDGLKPPPSSASAWPTRRVPGGFVCSVRLGKVER